MCVNGCTAENYRDFFMCQNHLWAAAKNEYVAPLKPEPKTAATEYACLRRARGSGRYT